MSDESSQGAQSLFVVAVGASAGGVAALEQFLSSTPSDTGAAFCGLLLISMTFRPPVLLRTACTATDELPEDDLTMVSPGFASAVSERMPQ